MLTAMARDLRGWFSQSGGASLERPNCWFGRPFDNLHQLTRVVTHGHTLQIVLDGTQVLTVNRPAVHRSVPEFFQIARFDSAAFRWVDEHHQSHTESYSRGHIVFHHVPGRAPRV
ncbi:hypothetical protein BH10ACT7_BH10ACT7_18630 [soil metagenome]